MKKQLAVYLPLLLIGFLVFQSSTSPLKTDAWGFFGHKRINRLAVFTLPQSLFGFYKANIEYITDHAVDPDKRRYSTKYEAIRHYIDIDHWGEYPFNDVPRDYSEAILRHAQLFVVSSKNDTIDVLNKAAEGWGTDTLSFSPKRQNSQIKYLYPQLLRLFRDSIFYNEQRYEDEWSIEKKVVESTLGIELPTKAKRVYIVDHFSEYGILPYYMLTMKNKLTRAFESADVNKILRLSADFGHYIGDAHVPLHTTENYNGQLTNQVGIHGFWESRIPELFADKEWDYMVGGAQYIVDPKEYFWDIVLTSSQLVDSVLNIEKRLSQEFPVDLQNCYTDRNGQNIKTQCEEYSRAFDEAMGGMVEERMQASIKAVGEVWYTCWVDGGRPNLNRFVGVAAEIGPSEEPKPNNGKPIKTRAHEN